MSGHDYPPDPHILRDLAFTTERHGVRTIIRAEATPWLAHGTDRLGVGVLSILLDVSGAATAIEAVTPDWIATVDLTYHGRPIPLGPIVIDVAPLRVGSKLVVMGAAVAAGEIDMAPCLGRGLVSFARIRGSATSLSQEDSPTAEQTPLVAARPLDQPIESRLGISLVDPDRGVIEMIHQDYARNSFGTINGGVVGLLCETAARHLGAELLAGPVLTHGLELHFLEQTRSGPVRTCAEVLWSDRHGATIRVELVDRGADDAVLAVGVIGLATTEPLA